MSVAGASDIVLVSREMSEPREQIPRDLSAEAQDALDGQLWEAAQTGNTAAIRRLVAEGASPSSKGPEQDIATQRGCIHRKTHSAVCDAAMRGHVNAVTALVRLGADLGVGTGWGLTALMCAAASGHVECARVLLAGGADHTARARTQGTGGWRRGKTALEMAVHKGHAEVVALLEEAA